MGKLLKKVLTSEDVPLMRVSGQGEVFFANAAGYVYLVELDGDGLSVNGAQPAGLRRSAAVGHQPRQGRRDDGGRPLQHHGHRVGSVALCTVGQPVVLDCSQQPTYVDVQSAVAWSAGLVPQVVSSMNMKSMLRGGSGEALQYAFHGPGFVVVQPSEWTSDPASSGGGGGLMGNLLNG